MTKTLAKEHNLGAFQLVEGEWSILPGSVGWEQLAPGAGGFVSQTYFDLAGLSIDDKTLFFEAAASTTMWNPLTTGSAPGDSCQVINLMSTTPLTFNMINRFLIYGNFTGNLLSIDGITFDQTIYCRLQEFTTDLDTASWGKMVAVSDNQIGSLEATASDRIYSYVIVAISGTPESLRVYPIRHLLQANPKEEAEYQYLMRLKRSYELQNQPDRD